MTNIVTATFRGGRLAQTRELYQWDYGQILQIEGLDLPSPFEIHFCNKGSATAEIFIGSGDAVEIPDKYLTTGKPVIGYVYLHTAESDGETVYRIYIPVRKRPKPDGQVTPEQEAAVTRAIAELNAGIERVEEIASSISGMAITIEDGYLCFTTLPESDEP